MGSVVPVVIPHGVNRSDKWRNFDSALRLAIGGVEAYIEVASSFSVGEIKRGCRGPCGLLPNSSVNAFPQQVGMPAMASIFLDSVHQEFPNRDTARTDTLSKVGMIGYNGVSQGLFAT